MVYLKLNQQAHTFANDMRQLSPTDIKNVKRLLLSMRRPGNVTCTSFSAFLSSEPRYDIKRRDAVTAEIG